MKFGPVGVAMASLLLGLSLNASEPNYTDAQNDGLSGPVRSISTTVERAQIEWSQPAGPTVARMVVCEECEYDPQGNRVKRGQIIGGEFRGEIIRFLRDGTGKVIERIFVSPEGEMNRRDVLGPYGITEQDGYHDGKQIAQFLWFYDANGHESGFRHYDQDGALVSSSLRVVDASGNVKEQWDSGPNGRFSLHFSESYDPKTDTFTFTNFNEDGSIKLAFTTVGTKLTSYWQVPGEENIFGQGFTTDPVGKTMEGYSCRSDGKCDHIFLKFADEARHLPTRIEWNDPEGSLKLAADYEYELDAFGNWTKRTVWVWSHLLGERKLYETDHRTLKYWGS